MKKIFTALAVLISYLCSAQSSIYLRGDSIRMLKEGGNAELILLNGTRDTSGVLFNMGNGRTRFRSLASLGISPGAGGLSGGNLTAEYRLYVPSLSGLKTITPRWAQLIDSVTTNVIGIGPDSTLVQPKLTISGSLLKNNNTLTFQNDGDYTGRVYGQLAHGVRGYYRTAIIDTSNRFDDYMLLYDVTTGQHYYRPLPDSAGGGVTTFTDGNGFDGTITGTALSLNTTVANTRVMYSTSGAPTGSANMTFDGNRLTLAANNTTNSLKIGGLGMQSFALNNEWLGSNVNYNAGFKAEATGFTPMIWFVNDGSIQFYTSPTSITAGAAAGHFSRFKIEADGNVSIGQNMSAITSNAHLLIGPTSASIPGLQFHITGAAVNTTPTAGVIDWNSSGELFYTQTTGAGNRRKFVYTNVATPANGQLPIGNGTDYTLANITSPNSTLTVTNGAGSIGLDIPATVLASANFTATINADPPGFFDNNPVVTVLRSNYIRVGTEVTVNLYVSLTHDATATITAFGVQLPIPSNLTSANQLFGDGTANITASGASAGADMTQANVIGDATNDQAIVAFTTSSAGTHFVKVSFTYTIL